MRHASTTILGLSLALIALPGLSTAGLQIETEQTAAETYGSAEDLISPGQALDQLLALCNLERAAAELQELKRDARATELAEGHADEMAHDRYLNHRNTAGLKCERRFNQIGGLDHVAENLAYYKIRGPADEEMQVFLTPQLVERVFTHWIESDTHRANILDPAHTNLGAAFVLEHEVGTTVVAAAMELTSHYGEYEPLPLSARRGDQLLLTGTLDPSLARLAYIGLGIETAPVKHAAEYLAGNVSGYSQPGVKFLWMPVMRTGEQPSGAMQVGMTQVDAETGEFKAELYLARHWEPGAYYFTLWAEPVGRDGAAFRAMTQVVDVE